MEKTLSKELQTEIENLIEYHNQKEVRAAGVGSYDKATYHKTSSHVLEDLLLRAKRISTK